MNAAPKLDMVRPYIPLIGFVLPTLVVGYGFVIPHSCIAGVNELSIGFGTTVLGAAFTYVAGQRAARPQTLCTKPPLRVLLTRAINRQAAAPSGWFGRVLGWVWPREHGRLNAEVLGALDVQPGHDVLEVGCGTGHALHGAAKRSRHGSVVGSIVGIDVSELMVRLATAKNRHDVARGTVSVQRGDIALLPLGAATFDRIFSVHSIYFWSDTSNTLTKLAHALRPEGKLVLAFRPHSPDLPARFVDPTYRFPQLDDIATTLHRAGLDVESVQSSACEPGVFVVGAVRR